MPDTIETIAALLADHRPRVKNQGYPKHVRRRVGRWARSERAAGRRWVDIARRLPVSPTSLQAWARTADEERSNLVPVVVADPAPTLTDSSTPTLVTPRGYRVEGLDLDGLVRLVERLG